ncbi:MAG: hypothetical protein GXP45_00400 [bacterium]|nr:hypothetical protein [bacterium]
MFFGRNQITTGASNDFEKATGIVKDMIIKYGMDDDLGPILYFDKEREDFSMYKPFSEKTAEIIDQKIKDYIFSSYEHAKKLVKAHKIMIEEMAKVLLEKEYLNKQEFLDMVKDIKTAKKFLNEAIENKKKIIQNPKHLPKKSSVNSPKSSSRKKTSFKKKGEKGLKDVLDKFL